MARKQTILLIKSLMKPHMMPRKNNLPTLQRLWSFQRLQSTMKTLRRKSKMLRGTIKTDTRAKMMTQTAILHLLRAMIKNIRRKIPLLKMKN